MEIPNRRVSRLSRQDLQYMTKDKNRLQDKALGKNDSDCTVPVALTGFSCRVMNLPLSITRIQWTNGKEV